MGLKIIQGNVLDANADALILTIDGAAKGMEGNIARSFARRWPEVWEELGEEIPYPLPLGKVFEYEPVDETPFGLILIASTLHHKDTLSESQKKSVVRSALERAIDISHEYGLKKVSSGLMLGGWRLSPTSAFLAMSEGYEECVRSSKSVDLDVYILDTKHFSLIENLAAGMGWR